MINRPSDIIHFFLVFFDIDDIIETVKMGIDSKPIHNKK